MSNADDGGGSVEAEAASGPESGNVFFHIQKVILYIIKVIFSHPIGYPFIS
jgi:hypothetical protein